MIVDIFYDGECPFCRNFVAYSRLKKNCEIILHDLRGDTDAVRVFSAMGYDLNQGMIVRIGNEIHFGADAVYIIGLLSDRSSLLSKAYYYLLSNQKRSRLLYPVMRLGRNLTLRLLGKSKI